MSVFKYSCANCGAPATKPPLKAASKEEAVNGTLGSFRCTSNCKRGRVKVKRERV